MLVLGLTGGIATGKSTVASILSSPPYSLPLIDADQLAREVVLPGTPGFAKIVAHFGPSIPDLLLPPDEHGKRGLNRPALGRHIFANDAERKVLNAIIHPEVRKAIFRRLVYHWLVSRADIVVLDIPLLFEAKFDLFCGATMVVACTPDLQRERLMKRDGHVLTDNDAEQRMASQMPIEEKAQLADVVVWNNKGLDELNATVAAAIASVRPSRLTTWLEWFPPFGLAMALACFVRRYFSKSGAREKKT
ncbi:dephospho-CoA kinase-domain-containing protein [Lipomyces tetrasporus]|jgi:dephospho-CoA kinase|uniref:Dephospho-CoA kinase-domain-containing protein n=1 Tax=Lipomyces tetrasporus TaxID=54092 RepID=A0AAD7QZM4_9ASCO|nr:dephospho-CoA kinase-domain-containing protein [Lipomyces tetrasporus]KAJ8102752.1 dephospho-CoA kinase-domain-containing protein [Lipomyces tetrasporus]